MDKQRLTANLTRTAVDAVHYGGTVALGLVAFDYLNSDSPYAVALLILFVIFIEGVLRTILTELIPSKARTKNTDGTATPDAAAGQVPANTEGASR